MARTKRPAPGIYECIVPYTDGVHFYHPGDRVEASEEEWTVDPANGMWVRDGASTREKHRARVALEGDPAAHANNSNAEPANRQPWFGAVGHSINPYPVIEDE
jgi:hypothetical protein